MPSTKCEGLGYPTHFLKSRGSVIRNNFLEYSTKQATFFAPRNDFNALFASIKAKHAHSRHFSSVIRNNFLEYSTKQATRFAPRNDFNALFASNKAKHAHSRHFSSCSDTIYTKSIKNN